MKNGSRSEGAWRGGITRFWTRCRLLISIALVTIAYSGNAQACSLTDYRCILEELKGWLTNGVPAGDEIIECAIHGGIEMRRIDCFYDELQANLEDYKNDLIRALGSINGVPFIQFADQLASMKNKNIEDVMNGNILTLIKGINSPGNPLMKMIMNERKKYIKGILIDDLPIRLGEDKFKRIILAHFRDPTQEPNINNILDYDDSGSDSDWSSGDINLNRIIWGFNLPIETGFKVNIPATDLTPPTNLNARVSFPIYTATGPTADGNWRWWAGGYPDRNVFFVNVTLEAGPNFPKTAQMTFSTSGEVSFGLVCRNNASAACMVTQINARGHFDYAIDDRMFEVAFIVAAITSTAALLENIHIHVNLATLIGVNAADLVTFLLNFRNTGTAALTRAYAYWATNPPPASTPVRNYFRRFNRVYPTPQEGDTMTIDEVDTWVGDAADGTDLENILLGGNTSGNPAISPIDLAEEVATDLPLAVEGGATDATTFLNRVTSQVAKTFSTYAGVNSQKTGIAPIFLSVSEPEVGFTWLNPNAMNSITDITPGFESNTKPDFFRLSLATSVALGINFNFGDQDDLTQNSYQWQVRTLPTIIGALIVPITQRGVRKYNYGLW